jgi:ketosteroid isomerase-like protein
MPTERRGEWRGIDARRRAGRSGASRSTAMDKAAAREAEAFYHAYIAAFRRGDAAALAGMATQPMARIGPQGGVHGPELVAHAPDPKALAARTGWADTLEVTTEVLDATADKVHLHLKHALRVRADGSPIERVSGIYTLLKGADGAWRIASVSVITRPA